MRIPALIVALAFVAIPATSIVASSGQHDNPPQARITDPVGDVVYYVTHTGDEVPAPPEDQKDIVSATMRMEDENHLALDILLAEEPDIAGPDRFAFHFMFGERAYRVATDACKGGPWSIKSADSVDVPPEGWTYIACLDGDFSNRPHAHMAALVPTHLVLDEHGGGLRGGSQLHTFFAQTDGEKMPFTQVMVRDRAPDEGYADGIRLPIDQDAESVGFQLSSPYPIQFCNGGAGSILYDVVVDNLEDEPVTLVLGSESTPAEWQLLHATRLQLEPHETVAMTVLASVPFSHRHGTTDEFRLIAAVEDEPERRQVLGLGLHYPTVPQPAGHHPILYLHSDRNFAGNVHGWMNPQIESADPADTNEPVKPGRVRLDTEQGISSAQWTLPLQPALRIGLSFDSTGEGFLATAIDPAAPVTDATVRSEVLLCDPERNRTGSPDPSCEVGVLRVVAASEEEAFASPAGQPVVVEQSLIMEDAPARFDFEPGANLLLRVMLNRSTDVGVYPADLEAGLVVNESRLELPLLEYGHDLVSAFQAKRSLGLTFDKPSVRLINPGKSLAYNATVTNLDDQPHEIRMTATGHNAEWVDWVGAPVFELEAGASANAAFTVTAPPGASASEYAELTLIAQAPSDPQAVGLQGLRVVVTISEPVADESWHEPQPVEHADGKASSLTWSVIVLVAVLAGVRGGRAVSQPHDD